MRFSQWALLAAEYAKEYYCWDDALDDINIARDSYFAGDSPKEFIDALADDLDIDSYPELHWGKVPPGFDVNRYTIKPEQE